MATGTSGTAFITLTGLLTSETGSKSRSAASSHSAYCSRGLILPRSKQPKCGQRKDQNGG